MPYITASKIPGPYLKEGYCRSQLRYLHDWHNDKTENKKTADLHILFQLPAVMVAGPGSRAV